MRPLRCPRCHRESGDPRAAFCRGCGAPLRLSEELPPAPLSTPVAIDRRGEEDGESGRTHAGVVPPPLRPEPSPPAAPRARRDELADVDRSHWELGRPAPGRAEPSPAPPAREAPASPREPVRPAPSRAPSAADPAPPASDRPPPAAPPGAALPARGAAVTAPPARPAPRAAPPAPPSSGRAPSAASPGAAPPARRAPEGVVEVHVRRAEPWRRAAAWAIDGGPFLAGGLALAGALARDAGPAAGLDLLDFVARERVIVLSVLAAAALALSVYATLAHALAGATLGKRLLGLRVVGPDGARPTLARSVTRTALAAASGAALGLGFLLALFAPSGRALHDLLARTWVVDARP